uniref:Uncharacterized protein n=1 Tax=Arundo donax TaxID=35708 RepID=A0A0A9EZG4_ARUDO
MMLSSCLIKECLMLSNVNISLRSTLSSLVTGVTELLAARSALVLGAPEPPKPTRPLPCAPPGGATAGAGDAAAALVTTLNSIADTPTTTARSSWNSEHYGGLEASAKRRGNAGDLAMERRREAIVGGGGRWEREGDGDGRVGRRAAKAEGRGIGGPGA